MECVFACSRARGLWYFNSSINSLFGQNLSVYSLKYVRCLEGHPSLPYPGYNYIISTPSIVNNCFTEKPGTDGWLCGKPCFALLRAWKALLSLNVELLGKDTPASPQRTTPSSFLMCLYWVDSPIVLMRKNFNWSLSFIFLTIKLFSKVN